jgi:hypothetical protein
VDAVALQRSLMLVGTPPLPITRQEYTLGEQQVFNRYRSVILALLFANRIVGAPSVFVCAVEVALRHHLTVKRASHLAFRRSQNSHAMVQATTIAQNGRIKAEAGALWRSVSAPDSLD